MKDRLVLFQVGGFNSLVALRTRDVWGPVIADGVNNLLFGYVLTTPLAVL